jgi:poly(3-hydroxybutyrate) depolymerase
LTVRAGGDDTHGKAAERSMRSWQRSAMGPLLGALLGAGALVGTAGADTPTPAAEPRVAAGARFAPSPDGFLGAWLVCGPFERTELPDEAHLAPALGREWKLAAASDGRPVSLASALDAGHASDRVAYAAGVLRLAQGGRHNLLGGADDGVTVIVDGRRVFSHDVPRPRRDDDDLVPLDLTAGDHTLVLALHRHAGAWSFRARLLDAALEPPRGAAWVLPGVTADDARAAARRLSSVSLDRGVVADGYRPSLTVRFPEGAPRDVPLDVRARLVRSTGGEPLWDVSAGEVGQDDRSCGTLTVDLPFVRGDEVEDGDWMVHVEVAGRAIDLPFHPRREVRAAIARADAALGSPGTVPPSTDLSSLRFLRDRLAGFVARGDGDVEAQLADARELDGLAAALEEHRDPWQGRTGPMRRAYVSRADGRLTEVGLYVPPDFDPARRYPLIVALHGMNGQPMEMLMWLFGHDDPDHDGYWEERHPLPARDLEPLEAFVVAPYGHFNTMYRDLGEQDVMQAIDWMQARYPIDASRVTITGPSMGGIGAAACALHHPDRFAAAEPLCGYHSYFVRSDITGARLRPWEKFIAEQRSNVFWAENGLYVPMYVVHGTRDLPQENSGVLIDRYRELHYSMKDEHPDLGHDVWRTTYEDLEGAKWLLEWRRPLHPRSLRFKTPRTRWGDDAWLHVRELASSGAWGEVTARIDPDNAIRASTRNIADLEFDRDAERIDDAAPVTLSIDQTTLVFQAGEPIEVHRDGDAWKAGPAVHTGPYKHGTVTGPIRDVFHEPILFVWGASDPAQARANEEAARAWARVRAGVHVDYPVVSDREFLANGEPIANDKALFLVGNAKSNLLVRELEPSLPIRIDGDDVVLGTRHIGAQDGEPADRSQLGVAFIHPNPRRPDRYVVVVEGVGPLGTWRSASLPDMLPDYVVYDEGVERARGMLMLGPADVRAAGLFDNDWSLPGP